jgi:signal transduction histidine kinase
MTYMAICGVIAFLTGFPCAFLVFLHKPRTALKIVWSVFGTGLSFWGVCIFNLFTSTTAETALFWGRLGNYGAVFLPLFLFHMVVLLTNRYGEYRKQLFGCYFVYCSYLLAALIFPHLFIPSVTPKGVFAFYPDSGILYAFFPFMFFATAVSGLVILFQSYRVSSVIKQNQYKYFLIAAALGVFGGGTTFFYVFNIPIYPYGTIGVPLFNMAVAYIIVKYQLMDIRIFIRKSLLYLILISVITVLYLLAVWMVERLFHNVIGYQSFMGSFAVITILAALFVPLRNYIQSFAEQYVFRASYLQMAEHNDRLRQEVVRSERYKTFSELSRAMIIQLRNPLTVLTGYGHMLSKKQTDPEFVDKFKQVFDKEVERINNILNRLSQYSEIPVLELAEVDLVSLVHRAVESIEPQADHNRVKIVLHDSQTPQVFLQIDEKKMQRVLLAFLRFSMRAMPEGGQLWVWIEDSQSTIDISIKDTGRGLSPEELVRIFDPFLHLDQTEEDRYELSVAQNIVREHGGKVIVDSQEDVGSEFIISLPKSLI